MLANAGVELDRDDQRREVISKHKPMAVGENAILFSGLGRVDLKADDLEPADFEFFLINKNYI